jgi:hypothetical protein
MELLTKINELENRAIANKQTSNRYQLVPTRQLVESIGKTINDHGHDFSLKLIAPNHRAKKTTAHGLEITLNTTMSVMGDNIAPRLYVLNSFNGEKQLQVMAGMMRLVCSNGLVVGQELFKEKIRHIQGETFEHKIAALSENISNAIKFMSKMDEQIAGYMSVPTSRELQKSISQRLGFSKRLTDRLTYTFDNPDMIREEDRGENAWLTYNIINETMKRSSRSELAFVGKNIDLMDRVRNLALNETLTYSKAA